MYITLIYAELDVNVTMPKKGCNQAKHHNDNSSKVQCEQLNMLLLA